MVNPFMLNNKFFLITGASSGIGRVTAQILSQLGATVILVGRNEERLIETKRSLMNPQNHYIAPFDLFNTDEIPSWLKDMTTRIGRPLNGIVHSAGVHSNVPIRVINKKKMDENMGINLYAGIGLLKACTNKSVCLPGGSIVFITSVMGIVGQPGGVSYSASKGAIISMVKSAALEFAAQGTRVNCVAPGVVQTEMAEDLFKAVPATQKEIITKQHPLGLGQPEDVANSVSFLLSDASRWITGTTLVVDGGYTCH